MKLIKNESGILKQSILDENDIELKSNKVDVLSNKSSIQFPTTRAVLTALEGITAGEGGPFIVGDWDVKKESIEQLTAVVGEGYEFVEKEGVWEFRESTNLPVIDYTTLVNVDYGSSITSEGIDIALNNDNNVLNIDFDVNYTYPEGITASAENFVLKDINTVALNIGENVGNAGTTAVSGGINYFMMFFQYDGDLSLLDNNIMQEINNTTIMISCSIENVRTLAERFDITGSVYIDGNQVFTGPNVDGDLSLILGINGNELNILNYMTVDLDEYAGEKTYSKDKKWHCAVTAMMNPENITYEDEADRVSFRNSITTQNKGLPTIEYNTPTEANFTLKTDTGKIIGFWNYKNFMTSNNGEEELTKYTPFLLLVDSNGFGCVSYDIVNNAIVPVAADYIDEFNQIKVKYEDGTVYYFNNTTIEYDQIKIIFTSSQENTKPNISILPPTILGGSGITYNPCTIVDIDVKGLILVDGDVPQDSKDGDIFRVISDGKYHNNLLFTNDYIQFYEDLDKLIIIRSDVFVDDQIDAKLVNYTPGTGNTSSVFRGRFNNSWQINVNNAKDGDYVLVGYNYETPKVYYYSSNNHGWQESGGSSGSLTTDQVSEGYYNKYYTDQRVNNWWNNSGLMTNNLSANDSSSVFSTYATQQLIDSKTNIIVSNNPLNNSNTISSPSVKVVYEAVDELQSTLLDILNQIV